MVVTEPSPFWNWRGTRLRADVEEEQAALLEEPGQDVQRNHCGWEVAAE